jgi:CRP-like cAMP-binding protein
MTRLLVEGGDAQRQGSAVGNRLLASLSSSDRDLLAPYLKPVKLRIRQQLEAANRRIQAVYFLESGLGSTVGIGNGERRQAEVAIVGREGMTGIAVSLGAERSPHETFMQLEGRGQCIDARFLREAMAESRSLADCLLRFAHVQGVQIAQTAVANARGKIEERLARWLLMANDRIEGESIRLTHEFLALMLGARRAGVTIALNNLEAQRLIGNARGCISVLDRSGLIKASAGLYGIPEAEYSRLFPGV